MIGYALWLKDPQYVSSNSLIVISPNRDSIISVQRTTFRQDLCPLSRGVWVYKVCPPALPRASSPKMLYSCSPVHVYIMQLFLPRLWNGQERIVTIPQYLFLWILFSAQRWTVSKCKRALSILQERRELSKALYAVTTQSFYEKTTRVVYLYAWDAIEDCIYSKIGT